MTRITCAQLSAELRELGSACDIYKQDIANLLAVTHTQGNHILKIKDKLDFLQKELRRLHQRKQKGLPIVNTEGI